MTGRVTADETRQESWPPPLPLTALKRLVLVLVASVSSTSLTPAREPRPPVPSPPRSPLTPRSSPRHPPARVQRRVQDDEGACGDARSAAGGRSEAVAPPGPSPRLLTRDELTTGSTTRADLVAQAVRGPGCQVKAKDERSPHPRTEGWVARLFVSGNGPWASCSRWWSRGGLAETGTVILSCCRAAATEDISPGRAILPLLPTLTSFARSPTQT